MRKIKFRAWDDVQKQYSFPGKDRMYFTLVGTPCEIIDAHEDGYEMLYAVGYRFTLEQFTDLLDKDGKEVYENDIVQTYKVEYPTRKLIEDKRYLVEWGQFGFTLTDPKNPNALSHYVSPDLMAVIGDIHRNPELLK